MQEYISKRSKTHQKGGKKGRIKQQTKNGKRWR